MRKGRRVLADLHRVAQAMTCDHGRDRGSDGPTPQAGRGEPHEWGRPGGWEAPPRPSLRRKADRIALTGEVRGFPRLNRRPYGRGHGAQGHGDSGGDGRGVSLIPWNCPTCLGLPDFPRIPLQDARRINVQSGPMMGRGQRQRGAEWSDRVRPQLAQRAPL